MNILERFLRRMQRDRSIDPGLGAMLDQSFGATGSPDTSRQWQRLERAIAVASVPARRARTSVRLAFSLSLLGLIGIGYLLLHPQAGLERFSTGRGEQLAVMLPDSSEVLLNHTSALSFDRATFGRQRSITLTGEAFLKVRKNGSPFSVTTPLATILVVGTEFNVRVREEGYEVGVLQGTVRVNALGNDASVTVREGELLAGTGQATPGRPSRIDQSQYPGWMVGKLIFDRMVLEDLCREIEDRFDVRIRIDDPEMRGMRLTGTIDAKDARSALSTICALSGKQYRRDEQSYILY